MFSSSFTMSEQQHRQWTPYKHAAGLAPGQGSKSVDPITRTACCGAPISPRCKSGPKPPSELFLAIALLWALISTALVWYWMGYYGGSPAHEYFGRWVLAWFFTEIIPLPFGSIPYKGERYTIDSKYRYLS